MKKKVYKKFLRDSLKKVEAILYSRWTAYFLLVLVALFLCLYVRYIDQKTSHWMIDDAFISFRYSENLAFGKGLVYNEGERVEGYTNFLWVILLSIPAKIGIDIVPLSQYLSLISALLIIIILFHLPYLLYEKPPNPIFNPISCLFLAANTTFSLWILGGLESHLFLLFVISSIALYLHNPKSLYLPVLIAIATLTRPEGILVFGVTFLCKLISERKPDGKFLLIFLLLYLPYFIWRYSYYGFLFPNTFYAKVGDNIVTQAYRGLVYAYDFLKNSGSVLLFPAIFFFIGYRRFKMLYLSLMVFVFTAYVIRVGGDVLPQYRFFLPVLPIIYLMVQEGLRVILSTRIKVKGFQIRHITIIFVLVLIPIFIKLAFASTLAYINQPIPDKLPQDGKRFAEYLLADSNSGKTIAVNSAGALPYYFKNRAIDMLGLNDVHIAHTKSTVKIKEVKATGHERHDGAYVLSKRPDYIIFGSSSNPRLMFPGDLEIFQSKDFIKEYEPVVIRETSGEGWFFVYYRRIKDKPLDPNHYKGLCNYSYMEVLQHAQIMLVNRGSEYVATKEYEKAILEFTKALYISPNDTKTIFSLAMVYYNRGEIEKAIERFEEIGKLPVQDINLHCQTYNNLGSLYYTKKLLGEASSCFKKSLQLDSNNAYAKKMLEAIEQKKFLDKD
ncbi:MAG: hypothetical protein KKD66_26735 [Proteobacteria bacterium]|nr:hypothetical protein [Pseudomonadota bacterium]MBU1599040.1 hypothetical protein [bacterium]